MCLWIHSARGKKMNGEQENLFDKPCNYTNYGKHTINERLADLVSAKVVFQITHNHCLVENKENPLVSFCSGCIETLKTVDYMYENEEGRSVIYSEKDDKYTLVSIDMA